MAQYINFTDLKVVCPKDLHPLPNIDFLIGGYLIYKMMCFMDLYYGYNRIKMDPMEAPKTTFVPNHDNYCYNIIPFGLKYI